MKKAFSMILASALLVMLTACGNTAANTSAGSALDPGKTTAAASVEAVADPSKQQYTLTVQVNGNGGAWSLNADGEKQTTFRVGDTGFIEWDTSKDKPASIESDDM